MLKTLKLKNFRKHTDRDFSFGEGLVALRAENEGGKSTLIEAMLYALYGSRSLRNSLKDTVTHGQKENTLMVEACFEFDGEQFLFTRHKGGAEVYVNGHHEPYVTGQTEVTNFATQLIGADAATANKLMLSSQGNLRGALENGPKATAEMIEDLADFDLFDFLLEAMGKELALGSSSNLDRTIGELEQTLDGFGQVDYDAQIFEASQNLKMLNAMISREEVEVKVLEGLRNEANQQLKEVKKTNEHLANLREQKRQVETQLAESEKELDQIKKVVDASYDSDRTQELQVVIDGAAEESRTLKIYEQIAKLPSIDLEWEGDLDSLEREIKEKHSQTLKAHARIQEIQFEMRGLNEKMIKDKDCPSCGQEIENADEVNVELQSQLNKLSKGLEAAKKIKGEIQEGEQELSNFLKHIQPTLRFVENHSEYLEVDYKSTPPRFKWKGPTPVDVQIDLEQAKSELTVLQTQAKEYLSNQAKLKPVEDLVNLHRTKEKELALVLEASHELDASELQSHFNEIDSKLKETQASLDQNKKSTFAFHTSIQNFTNRKEYEQTSKQQVEEQIKRIRTQVKDLDFNNSLLKKVRLARPLVSDQLWNMVLSAVSSMFSKMRGERSIVSKDNEGFKVNGEAITGLSGSTLDILGAAIRVALIRTFVPNCPFIVYDEPFAAMDESRTTAMLGFITTSGFKQTLVVTHEDISEQVANQLIIL